jgi:hypothetical protein
MRLLLSQAQTQLAEYVDYGTCATDPRVTQRINMVIERLLPSLNPEKTLGRFVFPLVSSTTVPNTITMPRDIRTVLAAFVDYPTPSTQPLGMCACDLRQLVSVRSRWYEILPGGPITFTGAAPNVLSDLGTGFSSFDDITPDNPCYIRVYVDVPQQNLEGYVYVVGNDINGNPIQSLDNGIYRNVSMIAIPRAASPGVEGQNYVDSNLAYSSFISINKDPTVSRVKLYALSLDKTVQRPIAVYAPDELAPDYRRYKLNWCVLNQPANITVIAKRHLIPTTDPDADLLITNIGALKNGLQALKYEDAGSEQTAETHWQRALKILDSETKDYDGDYAATPQIQSTCWGGGDIWNLH